MNVKQFLLSLAALVTLASPPYVLADTKCGKCPYTCDSLGLGKKDCSARGQSGALCCVDLNNRGMEYVRALEAAGGGAATEQCPAGFQPSERKCSSDERKRGCKDMRLSNGQGCVRR